MAGTKTAETARARFLRLAPKRVSQVIQRLNLLQNCASSGYEFTEEEVDKMLGAIDRARQAMALAFKNRLDGQKRKDPVGFSF